VANDITTQRAYCTTNEAHMLAGLVRDLAGHVRDIIEEIERLREQARAWQATAAGLSQDLSNAEDEIEHHRSQRSTTASVNSGWFDNAEHHGYIYAVRIRDRETEDDPRLGTVMYSTNGTAGPWHDMVSGHPEVCWEVYEALTVTMALQMQKRQEEIEQLRAEITRGENDHGC
jgi:hypothetical protein